MTDNLIERAKTALEGVTPEPWKVEDRDPFHGHSVWYDDGEPGTAYVCREVEQNRDDGRADAEFIAAARSLVPELIAEVEKLSGAIKSIQDIAIGIGRPFHRMLDDILAVTERIEKP